MDGWVVLRDAEADRFEAVLACAVHEAGQQLVPEAAPAAARDDGNRELRRLLVDEPEAGVLMLEEPVPGGADRDVVVEDDQRAVSGSPPRVHVAGQRRLVITDGRPPVEGVPEHVAEEGNVARAALSDHGASLRAPCGSAAGKLLCKLNSVA